MAKFTADGVEILIKDGYWKLFLLQGKVAMTPFFTAIRGTGVVNYTVQFGSARTLPGDILGVDYIQAVIVGFDQKSQRWLLGLQVQMRDDEKPRWVGLVQWPVGDDPRSAADSHATGRILAEYIGRPLKLYGVKKGAVQAMNNRRMGVTGPVEPHDRVDVELSEVIARIKRQRIQLPLSEGEYLLSNAGNVFVLRLPRVVSGMAGREAPAYVQCVFDRDTQQVKLLPPTGLLGAFFGPLGRVINFQDIRNVEFRRRVEIEPDMDDDVSGGMLDVSRRRFVYAVYLTLEDESLLLMQSEHVTDPRQVSHVSVFARPLLPYGFKEVDVEMERVRSVGQDLEDRDKKANFVEVAALVLAVVLNRKLVSTKVGNIVD